MQIDQEFLNHITPDHKRKLEDALCESQQFQNFPEEFLAQLPKEIGFKFPRKGNTKIQASALIRECLEHGAIDALITVLYHFEGVSALHAQAFEKSWKTVVADIQRELNSQSFNSVQNSAVSTNNQFDNQLLTTKKAQLIIEGEFSKFDPTQLQELIGLLSARLEIKPSDIKILQVYQGSIGIILEIPDSAADYLYTLATKQDIGLKSLDIKSALVGDAGIIEFTDDLAKHYDFWYERLSKEKPVSDSHLSTQNEPHSMLIERQSINLSAGAQLEVIERELVDIKKLPSRGLNEEAKYKKLLDLVIHNFLVRYAKEFSLEAIMAPGSKEEQENIIQIVNNLRSFSEVLNNIVDNIGHWNSKQYSLTHKILQNLCYSEYLLHAQAGARTYAHVLQEKHQSIKVLAEFDRVYIELRNTLKNLANEIYDACNAIS